MRNTQKEKGDILLLFFYYSFKNVTQDFAFLKSKAGTPAIAGAPATLGTTSNSRDNQQQQEQPAIAGTPATAGTTSNSREECRNASNSRDYGDWNSSNARKFTNNSRA
jgi:hypothetical protein